jgi:hypothetical protein
MKDIEQARSFLRRAERDHRALCGMEDDIDRRGCTDGVARLLQHVRRILTQANA